MERVLDIDELAAELKLNPYTVRRYLREGRLAGAFQIGRRWRIPESSVQAYISDAQRQTAANVASPKEKVG